MDLQLRRKCAILSTAMICWSCEKNAGDGMLCAGCGAVQPPDRSADHFRVFGLPRKFDLDSRISNGATRR